MSNNQNSPLNRKNQKPTLTIGFIQEKISKELIEYNAINKQICNELNVSWFNITDISKKGINEPQLVAKDGLHPSQEQYLIWIESIYKDIKLKVE